MFLSNSRYATAETYAVRTTNGRTTAAVRLPVRQRPLIRGLHPRLEGQRLDSLAANYLVDATAFWRLCDASDALAPDALATREFVAIPAERTGR